MDENSLLNQKKEEERPGLFHFKPVASAAETVDQATLLERQRQAAQEKEKEEALLQQDIERIRNLKPGELFTDRTGRTIPRETYKKLGITVTEKDQEYRARLIRLIEGTRKIPAVIAKTYYSNDKSVNTVDIEQVTNNLSAQRRMMMKKALGAMADADGGRHFDDPAVEALYTDFLKKVKDYSLADGSFGDYYEPQKDGTHKQYVYTGNTKYELDTYQAMQSALEKIMTVCHEQYPDGELLHSLKGYQSLLSALSDGGLRIEEGVKTIHVRGETKIKEEKGDKLVKLKVEEDATNQPLFAHEPSIEDVVQGDLGDCYLLNALTSIVANEPKIIKDCMKDNKDGTVTVRFYRTGINVDAPGLVYTSEPMYFKVPKKKLGKKGARNALWVNVYERAFAAYRQYFEALRQALNRFSKSLPKDERDRALADIRRDRKKRDAKYKAELGKIDISNRFMIERNDYVIQAEYVRKNPKWAAEFDAMLAETMEKAETSEINIGNVTRGFSTDFFSVLTGKLHPIRDISYKSAKELNTLTGIYDYMKAHSKDNQTRRMQDRHLLRQEQLEEAKTLKKEYGRIRAEYLTLRHVNGLPKDDPQVRKLAERGELINYRLIELNPYETRSKEELEIDLEKETENTIPNLETEIAINEMAERVVRNILEDYSSKDENYVDAFGAYKSTMTREQLAQIIDRVKDTYLKDDHHLTERIQKVSENKMAAFLLGKLDGVDRAEERILEAAKSLLTSFCEDAEKNTALEYEPFSGKYSDSTEELFDEISNAIRARKAVAASSRSAGLLKGTDLKEEEVTINGVVTGHAFSVIGVKTVKTDDQTTLKFIRIRNPWGSTHVIYEKDEDGKLVAKQSEDDTLDGIDEIELNEFVRRFGWMTTVGLEDFK